MSTYYSNEPRSNFGLYFFLGVIAIGVIAIGLMATRCSSRDAVVEESKPEPKEEARDGFPPQEIEKPVPSPADPFAGDPTPDKTKKDKTNAEILTAAGMGVAELDPKALLRKIGDALNAQKIENAATLIGKEALNESHLLGLRALADAGKLKVNRMHPISEIGELEANRRSRWALNLDDEMGARIYFDLVRTETGAWTVEKIKVPPVHEDGKTIRRALLVDALGITDAFLASALEQNFDDAKSFVDSEKVSDAKIAGLCIIFEEAKYKLRNKKPLRAMFSRETTAGFMAHVEDATGERAAEFGINVQRAGKTKPWRVTEVNLDQLLADYATRVAGGDVHYTPLVKSPAGGDTLILYFGFDEEVLTPRTTRQLDIVASLLKLDANKKLTLSGHTDALGSDDYNTRLSAKRALAVKTYLLSVGVPPSQMVTLAEGEAKPRRPNVTEAGEDNPSGRRANRRTEIYLDF
ncbi:MAG: OmpA family protein [Akkermansiaceae bacterium]